MTQFIHRLPRQHKVVITLVLSILLLLILIPSEQASASRNTTQVEALEVGKRYSLTVPADLTIPLGRPVANEDSDAATLGTAQLKDEPYLEAVMAQAAAQTDKKENSQRGDELTWQSFEVRSGDSLARIFNRAGISPRQLHRLTQADGADILQRIHPGDRLNLGLNAGGELAQLSYDLSDIETLYISADENGAFSSSREVKEVEIRYGFASATISSSFWNAGVHAGLTQSQIMNLAQLFGWDIDFVLDIRAGDKFQLIYEKLYRDGEYLRDGEIIAAGFVNQGEKFEAIRFNVDGQAQYFAPDGRNMRKAFLRAPLNFSYISSNFNPKRFHPVLKRVKAHNGIDYRAPTGTPVYAAGDGKVINSAYNKFNGNYVFVQHANNIVTKYLHFSKRMVKSGQRVKQGQVIGLVGSTGMSTAPHLHYEFLVNGAHRNPRTVPLPKADPLDGLQLAAFQAVSAPLLTQLSRLNSADMYASNKSQ